MGINIGWPEGILLTLMLSSLAIVAMKNGEDRPPFNFPVSLVGFMITMLLLWQGEFFA